SGIEKITRRRKKILATARDSDYVAPRPNSHVPVAVCRSVGIRTRGRTAAWGRVSLPRHRDRQPEAKPAHPALNGGRGLKQRRSGLFWSRRLSKGRHRRGLFIFAGRAERVSR